MDPRIHPHLRYGLIAAVLAVGSVLALPFLVPVGAYRSQIEQGVTGATGRNFKIGGGLRLTLFPQLGVRAQKVTLANVPGARAPTMAAVDEMRVAVRLLPLLTGHIEVSQIVLDAPQIYLEVDSAGRSNWTFPHDARKAGDTVRLPGGTRFSGVVIQKGRITYFDARTGTARAIDNLDATVDVTRLDRPLAIDGSFALAGRSVDFDAKITTPHTMLEGAATGIDLSLTSAFLQSSFKGVIDSDGAANGQLKFDAQSARRAGTWLGEQMPPGGGLGTVSLESHIAAQNRIIALSDLKLALDHMTIAGYLTVDTAGDVPGIKGALTIDRLNLNPYLETAPKQTRPAQTSGWSAAPLNFGMLKKVNADLVLDAGALDVRNLKLGKTHLAINLHGGLLSALLNPIALYGGTGHAELDVDDRGAVPTFHNKFGFDNVSVEPLLADAMDVDKVEGTGTIALDASSQGTNANAIMHALSGKSSVAFRNGRIRGVDLGAVARTIAFVLGGGATTQDALTNFSTMGATFAIARGVLSTKDFHLAGPLLNMTGAGTIDVADRKIDFRVVPKAAASIGKQNVLNIGVPFRIGGTWNRLRYSPDVVGLVKGVFQNLENGRSPLKDLISGPAGNAASSSGAQTNKKKHKNVGETLKNMFGIH